MNARWIAALVAVAALVPSLSFAQPATPAATNTPAATASPDGPGLRRSDANPVVPGAKVQADPQTFEGGIQVGTTASGATELDFVSRVTCTLDVVSPAAAGATVRHRCAATGAAAGDFAACVLPVGSVSGTVIKSVTAGTNFLDIEFVEYQTNFPDIGTVAIQCLVVR